VVDLPAAQGTSGGEVGGSADVVSGAFEHTINMQVQGGGSCALFLSCRVGAPPNRVGRQPQDMYPTKTITCRPQGKKRWV
jgi:hypothetical protein